MPAPAADHRPPTAPPGPRGPGGCGGVRGLLCPAGPDHGRSRRGRRRRGGGLSAGPRRRVGRARRRNLVVRPAPPLLLLRAEGRRAGRVRLRAVHGPAEDQCPGRAAEPIGEPSGSFRTLSAWRQTWRGFPVHRGRRVPAHDHGAAERHHHDGASHEHRPGPGRAAGGGRETACRPAVGSGRGGGCRSGHDRADVHRRFRYAQHDHAHRHARRDCRTRAPRPRSTGPPHASRTGTVGRGVKPGLRAAVAGPPPSSRNPRS